MFVQCLNNYYSKNIIPPRDSRKILTNILYLTDSAPSSVNCSSCPPSRSACPPSRSANHQLTGGGTKQPPQLTANLGPDFARLGARPKTGNHRRDNSVDRLSPLPATPSAGHTREHSEHSGNNLILLKLKTLLMLLLLMIMMMMMMKESWTETKS